MARSALILVTVAILTVGLCGGFWLVKHSQLGATNSSVTVKLPPARPSTPQPGFAFSEAGERR